MMNQDWWTSLSLDQWAFWYRVAMVLLLLSYAFRSILFLVLHPRDRLEWATFLAAASMVSLFGTLTYWHFFITSAAIRPAVYPPLVLAFWFTAIASVIFTYVAWRDWLSRRVSTDYGNYERYVVVIVLLLTVLVWGVLMMMSRSHG